MKIIYQWFLVLCVLAALFGICAAAFPQIPAPQINLTGNIGCQGFPCLNSGTLSLTTDANHTMTAQETSAFSFKVTSTVSLTATRNLIFPSGKFPLGCVENATIGGQAIQVIGTSGTGVPIPNGSAICGIWNDGTNFVAGSTGGGASPVAPEFSPQLAAPGLSSFVTDPNFIVNTSTHTIDENNAQFAGTVFNTIPNDHVTGNFTQNNTAPFTPAATGNDSFGTEDFIFNSSGFGKDIGFTDGISADDSGVRAGFGPTITTNCNSSGICQAMHITNNHNGAGDTAIILSGSGSGHTSGGYKAGSDEGVGGVVIEDTQYLDFCTGTITSTTGLGDIAPVVECANPLVNDGYLVDTSQTILAGNLTGTGSAIWDSNPISIQQLSVSSTVVPSTGIASTTTSVVSSTILGVPQSQSVTVTVVSGTLTTGLAWFVSPFQPEQVKITGVVGTTVTLLSAGPHPPGSFLIQGGTHGILSFDDDLSMSGVFTDFLVVGGADASHLLIAYPSVNGLSEDSLPIPGTMAASLTSGFHVHPGARIVSLAADNLTIVTEQNDVTWAAGDAVVSPFPASYHEDIFFAGSTQSSMADPSFGSQSFFARTSGAGATQAYRPFSYVNSFARSHYFPVGTLAAPTPFVSSGPIGNSFEFDDPIPDSPDRCAGGTVLCDTNSNGDTKAIFLYRNAGEGSTAEFIEDDRPNQTWDLNFGLVVGRSLTVTSTSLFEGAIIAPSGGTGTEFEPFGGTDFTAMSSSGTNATVIQNQIQNLSSGVTWNYGVAGTSGFGSCASGTFDVALNGNNPVACFGNTAISFVKPFTIPTLFIGSSQALTGVQGTTGANVFSCTGTFTVNDLVSIDANGNCVDSGILKSSVPFLTLNNTWTAANQFNGVTSFLSQINLLPATPATSSANISSPNFDLISNYWTGTATAADNCVWSDIPATGNNPLIAVQLTCSGSSGGHVLSISIPEAVPSLSATGAVTASNVFAATTPLTFTGTASGVTVTCFSGFTCTSKGGTLSVVSTSFTTGTVTTLTWPATPSAPTCIVSGTGSVFAGFGNSTPPTTTGFTLSNNVTIAGTTQFVEYLCQPNL